VGGQVRSGRYSFALVRTVRRRRAQRARALAAAAGSLALIAAVVIGVSQLTSSDPARAVRTGSAAPTTTRADPATTGSAPVTAPSTSATTTVPPAPIAIGTTTLQVAATTGGGDQTLPVIVRYPAAADGAVTGGPYPLVVFSQGFDIAAESYSGLLDAWTHAGYVVADPTYPDTSPGSALDEADIIEHPAELSAVITALIDAGGDSSSPLHGAINPHRVGIVGHSDGGDVTLATAANTCCRDPRVTAAVILSGAELSSFGGSYYGAGSVPLLVVQGSADTVNLPADSQALYDAAPQPKYFLDLLGADHRGPYLGGGTDESIVIAVTVDFLDGYLDGDSSKLGALTAAGTQPGVATITSGPTAP
jgi:predicted dienelactone hydrolase